MRGREKNSERKGSEQKIIFLSFIFEMKYIFCQFQETTTRTTQSVRLFKLSARMVIGKFQKLPSVF